MSAVHGLLSSQTTPTPRHAPLVHTSLLVHALPSSHGVLLAFGVKTQPTAGLQVSSVQKVLSSQARGEPVHTPEPLHESLTVQAEPSLQGVPGITGVCTQPPLGLHESAVQGLPSSQLTVEPTHVPLPLQASALVHALESLQAVPPGDGVVLQPVAGSHESSVQGLPSLHTRGAPPPQVVSGWQLSLMRQWLPVLQLALVGALTQPVVGTQLSAVHELPSLQLAAAPPQVPDVQESLMVQALPSLHAVPFATGVKVHCMVVGLQESTVHGLLSLHITPMPLHTPLVHTSLVVQALPSLQVMGVPTQLPVPLHASDCVHADESLHAVPAATGVVPHAPVAGVQTGVTQVLPPLVQVAVSEPPQRVRSTMP